MNREFISLLYFRLLMDSFSSNSASLPAQRFNLIYIGVAILLITSLLLNISWLYFATKTLLIPVLWLKYRKITGVRRWDLVGAALCFSWLGDIALAIENNDYWFMAGLAAFMMVQVCYTWFFIKDILDSRPWNHHWFQMALVTFIIVYAVEFYILNRFAFENIWLPVIVYICLIALMGIATVLRDRTNPVNTYWQVVAGACFFITSDSVLAINKFVLPFEYAGVIVMTCYIVAQYLIIQGCINIRLSKKITN